MPSAFAHATVGACLACSLPRTAPRRSLAMLLLATLAAAPDLDVIGFRIGIPYAAPLGHRGWTHSLAFAAICACATWPAWRAWLPTLQVRAATLTFAAVASHGLLDTLTDAGLGVGLFLPFDAERYFAPWRPIDTSPLSVAAFFSRRGLAILTNEALWIGTPCIAYLGLLGVLRRARPIQSA